LLVLVEQVTVLRPRRRSPAVVEAHVAKRPKGALVHAAVQTVLERKGLSPPRVSRAFLAPRASSATRASSALHTALPVHVSPSFLVLFSLCSSLRVVSVFDSLFPTGRKRGDLPDLELTEKLATHFAYLLPCFFSRASFLQQFPDEYMGWLFFSSKKQICTKKSKFFYKVKNLCFLDKGE